MATKDSKEPAMATGTVHGLVITLDALVPELEGRRVRVLLRPTEDPDVPLGAGRLEGLWQEWLEHGEQGPLDDGEDAFP